MAGEVVRLRHSQEGRESQQERRSGALRYHFTKHISFYILVIFIVVDVFVL
jgi:hypothetical protein